MASHYKDRIFIKLLQGRDFIIEAKTLMSTHWMKKCEACLFRATPKILAGLNGFYLNANISSKYLGYALLLFSSKVR